MGNFSGSELQNLKNSEIAEVMSHITESQFRNTARNVAEVTVVPSPRDEDKDKFVQGIEKIRGHDAGREVYGCIHRPSAGQVRTGAAEKRI